MNKDEFQKLLAKAAQDGTLKTPKHDPANLSTTWGCYRTVLKHELAPILEQFISSGEYEVTEYDNPSLGNLYYEIRPTSSAFDVPASGVTSYSPVPTDVCDRLVAVEGHKQGWHLFGENSATIRRRLKDGSLKRKRRL
jgi:hypothetical protein